MRRRDAVLIAVLVNAGLMVFLFTLAMTGHDGASSSSLPVPGQGELVELIPAGPLDDGPLQQDSVILAQSPTTERMEGSEVAFVPTVSLGEAEQVVQPSPPVPVATSTSVPARTYTVKKGDVLEKIAKQHQVTVAALMKANQLKSSSRISIGQVLTIPASNGPNTARVAATAEAESSRPTVAQGAAKYYTVRKGDNVWAIATRHHLKTEELLRLNQLTPEMARKLRPGDRLRVQ